MNIICILMGYCFGSFNPAYLIAKLKGKNLRKLGTGNLGTTNATMVLGKKYGIIVFIVDFFKGYLSYKISKNILKRTLIISLLVGVCSIIGHILPFYLDFKGGKGLLTFIGVMFAFDSKMCFVVLLLGALFTYLINYSFVMPYSISILFCIFATISTLNFYIFLITLGSAIILMTKHYENAKKAKDMTDIKVRDYFKSFVFNKKIK